MTLTHTSILAKKYDAIFAKDPVGAVNRFVEEFGCLPSDFDDSDLAREVYGLPGLSSKASELLAQCFG